jgi:adenylate cyclase
VTPDQQTAILPSFDANSLESQTRVFQADPSRAMTISMSGYRPNSIAVLPFAHLSSDADDEYFCDGLAEELINALSRVDDLKVVARTSAFSFKGKNIDIAQIGAILNVNNVVEGSVRKFGERMRINVQLINTADGYNIWSDKYDTEMRDIFDVQDEITRSVVKALKTKLLGEQDRPQDKTSASIEALKQTAHDVEAYKHFLRGRFFLNKFTPDNFYKALDCFDQAIAIDANFADAYAGLADAHMMLTEMGPVPPHEAMPKAKEAALKALSLDNELSEAYSSLGLVQQDYEYDFAAAEQSYLKAIELNPSSSLAHQGYALLLAQLGRHDEAREEFKKTLAVDPLSVVGNWVYSFGLFMARRYDRCIEQTNRALELDPNFPAAYLSIAFAYHMKGNHAESVEAYAKYNELSGSAETANVIRESFRGGGWLGFLQTMAAPDGPFGITAYIVAVTRAALGDTEGAIDKLEESFERREPHIVMMKVDPRFDEIRGHERFQALIKAVGFPEAK